MTTFEESTTGQSDVHRPAQQGVLDDAGVHRIVAQAKALGDPVRLRIYAHIAASGCSSVCACHLPEVFGVSQPTLSHHLKKLVDAGLVEREMRGRWAHFTVRPTGPAALRNFLIAISE